MPRPLQILYIEWHRSLQPHQVSTLNQLLENSYQGYSLKTLSKLCVALITMWTLDLASGGPEIKRSSALTFMSGLSVLKLHPQADQTVAILPCYTLCGSNAALSPPCDAFLRLALSLDIHTCFPRYFHRDRQSHAPNIGCPHIHGIALSATCSSPAAIVRLNHQCGAVDEVSRVSRDTSFRVAYLSLPARRKSKTSRP